jgi:iron complex transport system substrate-binding protein
MVRLIEDAGGEYILTENEKRKTENENNSSTPISLEEALLLAMKADFWINLGQFNSIEEVCAAAPRFAKVDAVRFGRLYNNTKRTNESRGSDFWESGAVRPDLILADLVKILHYEAPTDSLYYYKKLGDRR